MSKFDGNAFKFRQWLENLDTLTSSYPDEMKMRFAVALSTEPVRQAITNYIRENPTISFKEFKKELRSRYDQPFDLHAVMTYLRSLKQGEGESFQLFADRFELEISNVVPEFYLLSPEIEKCLPGIFLDGLKNKKVQRKIFFNTPMSLRETIKAARSVNDQEERYRLHENSLSSPLSTKQSFYQEPQINMVTKSNPTNHMFYDKQIKCSICSRTNHTTDNCFMNKQIRPLFPTGEQKQYCPYCHMSNHTISICQKRLHDMSQPQICGYCNTPGHNFNRCRKRQFNLNNKNRT
jgi:hypothetical protein